MRKLPFLLLCVFLSAFPTFALEYRPYDGHEGYQEIDLGQSLYFVAFHGKTSTATADELETAWKTRAAQLCMWDDATHFIELQYSFEPVLKDDPPLSAISSELRILLTRGAPIVVPIFVPHNQGEIVVDAPSRQAHVRCVLDSSTVIDPKRLQEITAIIENAKTRGWKIDAAK
jgi:hypothetical protein